MVWFSLHEKLMNDHAKEI